MGSEGLQENLAFITTPKIKAFADDVKSILRIGSAHNKGGPTDINIAQISHLSNFFWHKILV